MVVDFQANLVLLFLSGDYLYNRFFFGNFRNESKRNFESLPGSSPCCGLPDIEGGLPEYNNTPSMAAKMNMKGKSQFLQLRGGEISTRVHSIKRV